MAVKNLVIVESPGKVKTISRYLGNDFKVEASMGHVRDLPKSQMGIETEKNFKPKYLIPKDKSAVIKNLKGKIGKNTVVWVATDEDREGEAIGWHLVEALDAEKVAKEVKRIVFHEITKPAILAAIEHPREIDMNLVNSQQARRVLDRLVGYELSPLLWKKIKYGLSAGRVQSVGVRLIVDREREIEAFNPEEYWSLTALMTPEKKTDEFEAKLTKFEGKGIKPGKKEEVDKILKDLEGAKYEVTDVEKKEVKRNPAPPFITSTLQQEASRKLGFSVKKTMMVAQKLYEGMDIDGEHEGLITYMRTDSVNLSELALKQAREVITDLYGAKFALEKPRFYKGRKGAQEAHEAIRPTDFTRKPVSLKKYLKADEYRLYELIWKRALACQMEQAVFDQVGVDITANDYIFRATGQTVKFAGFMEVYLEGKDLPEEEEEDRENYLPELTKGEHPRLKELKPAQHFTKPPARYTEASLVKKLEAEGIGRPSTYAPTISTIQTRGYIEKEEGKLKPTDMGYVVNDFLVEHFPKILDLQFTVRMEDMLDEIEEGNEKWQDEVKEFYVPFHKLVEEKMESVKKEDVITDTTDEVCELCGKPMMVKLGRFGKFLSCTGFPECKNAKPLDGEGAPKTEPGEERVSKEKCGKCGKPMVYKTGRFGEYLACQDYPECKTSKSIVTKVGVNCPECRAGELVERHTKRGGKPFYGCSRFPKCKFAIWEKPKNMEDAKKIKEAEGNGKKKKGKE
ncbi:type I DNA topoisomerase [Patescibacteria group bacterium]|nr:type I DNA topoisomerase [Patescibacteria group bacterium]